VGAGVDVMSIPTNDPKLTICRMVHSVADWHRAESVRINAFQASDVVPVRVGVGSAQVVGVDATDLAKVVLCSPGVELDSCSVSSPWRTLIPGRGIDATTVPFLRQMEQLQRLALTIPSGRSSSRTTLPQWHDARCFPLIWVPPTSLITRHSGEDNMSLTGLSASCALPRVALRLPRVGTA
jgi:hypothetical protein